MTIKDEAAADDCPKPAGQRRHAAKHPKVRHRAGALEGQAGRRRRKLAEKLAKLANEFAEKIAKVYIHEAFSAGSLDASSVVVPAAMEQVALGRYEAEQFDGQLKECLRAEMVVFSGLKIDKLDDLEAMIDRGKIRLVIAAGSLAMALKKAAAELDGRQFDLGLSEDPAHNDKPYFIPARADRAGQADDRRRAGQGDRVRHAGRFRAPGRPGFARRSGRATSSSTWGPPPASFIARRRWASSLRRTRPTARRRWFSTTACSACSRTRVSRQGTRKFVAQLKRMTDAGHQGLHRRRRRRHGAGEVRPAGLGHLLLHGRRHGAERLGQRAGAVSGGAEDGSRADGTITAQIKVFDEEKNYYVAHFAARREVFLDRNLA